MSGLVEVRMYTRCVQNGCCKVDAGKLLDLDLHSRDRVHRDKVQAVLHNNSAGLLGLSPRLHSS